MGKLDQLRAMREASGSKEPEAKLDRQDDRPEHTAKDSAAFSGTIGSSGNSRIGADAFVEMGGQDKQPKDIAAHQAKGDAVQGVHGEVSVCPTCGQSRRGYMRDYMRHYRKAKKAGCP